jgi:hypothetical protein
MIKEAFPVLSESENVLRQHFFDTWKLTMRNVQSTAPDADPLIAVYAAADLMEETILQAFKGSTPRGYLDQVETLVRRISDVKRNAAPL